MARVAVTPYDVRLMAVSMLARLPFVALATALAVTGCSLLEGRLVDPAADDRFPDVLAVELRPRGERVFDVAVTISSPYDTPQRYADGWRVLDPKGEVLGTHTLLHDHASEQPFTRVQRGLRIPAGVGSVTVEGRDRENGFGGRTLTVEVPE